MSADTATTLFIDCGTMVGHQQQELELIRETVPYFGINPNGHIHALYIPVILSDGTAERFRMIFREDNDMWRIEFSNAVPEIANRVMPGGGRRWDHAAVFTKVGSGPTAAYELNFLQEGTPAYDAELHRINASGHTDRSRADASGRNYGWC